MQTKKTKKTKVKSKTAQPTKSKTPFRDVGGIVGTQVSNTLNKMFDTKMDLNGFGKWLGTGIGSIFGSGDYTITGSQPESNVLMNSREIPKFSTTRSTNVVCHREYIRDWTGVSPFTNQGFYLNPGDANTFPWLASIAQNYQQYKFHGIVFEFKSLITDYVTSGSPGVVVMATNYNAADPLYYTKQEMENSEFAVAVKPTVNLMHGIECAVDQTSVPIKYIRTGAVPDGQDRRLYDLGLFQFANQGSPNQLIGEIWVSYCVEFFKPILPNTVGGNILSCFISRSGVVDAAPFGTTTASAYGNMNVSASATAITFDVIPNCFYAIAISWDGGNNNCAIPTPTGTNIEFVPKVRNSSGVLTNYNASYDATTTTCSASGLHGYFKTTATSPDRGSFTIAGTGKLPSGGGYVSVTITHVDNTIFEV